MTGLFHWSVPPFSTKRAVRRNAERMGKLALSRSLLRRTADAADNDWDADPATGAVAGLDRTEALFGPFWRGSQDLLLVCDRQGAIQAANPFNPLGGFSRKRAGLCQRAAHHGGEGGGGGAGRCGGATAAVTEDADGRPVDRRHRA